MVMASIGSIGQCRIAVDAPADDADALNAMLTNWRLFLAVGSVSKLGKTVG